MRLAARGGISCVGKVRRKALAGTDFRPIRRSGRLKEL
jgi:hypothetical protein